MRREREIDIEYGRQHSGEKYKADLTMQTDDGKRTKITPADEEEQPVRHGFRFNEKDQTQVDRAADCRCDICDNAIQALIQSNFLKATTGPDGPRILGDASDGPLLLTCFCREGSETHVAEENLVFCDRCKTWQHFECYYSGQQQVELLDLGFEHVCPSCRPSSLWPGKEEEKKSEKETEIPARHGFHSDDDEEELDARLNA